MTSSLQANGTTACNGWIELTCMHPADKMVISQRHGPLRARMPRGPTDANPTVLVTVAPSGAMVALPESTCPDRRAKGISQRHGRRDHLS